MNKLEIIKSLYEELTDVERRECYNLLKPKIEQIKLEPKAIDFYSNEFINFIIDSNYFRKQLYLLDCGEINVDEYAYVDNKSEKHIFSTYDEAEKYYEENFENVMKMRYSEDSDEYQCFEILSSFDFENVEKSCKKLGYTYGLENKSITKSELIKDAVEMLRYLCLNKDAKIKQVGRLNAVKIEYPEEDGGNYYSLMYCIEQWNNAY